MTFHCQFPLTTPNYPVGVITMPYSHLERKVNRTLRLDYQLFPDIIDFFLGSP